MGTLYLVATPIGNLEDITLRALRVLREVPLIAAEDTRHTRGLLTHFAITTPTTSYHEHSPPARLDALLSALANGDVALVTDAGTPVISDPGADLVRAALAAGHTVVPVPGPVAAIAALIGSGLPAGQFTYLGFLPRRVAERRSLLESVRLAPQTLVLYEAPHRVLACLDDLSATLGNREAALARELTKLHEQWLRGPLLTLRAYYATAEHTPRGEYTIVVAGATATLATDPEADPETREATALAQLQLLLLRGAGTRAAASEVARATGLPRRDVYRLALSIPQSGETDSTPDSTD